MGFLEAAEEQLGSHGPHFRAGAVGFQFVHDFHLFSIDFSVSMAYTVDVVGFDCPAHKKCLTKSGLPAIIKVQKAVVSATCWGTAEKPGPTCPAGTISPPLLFVGVREFGDHFRVFG
jgi:hypothetical protein